MSSTRRNDLKTYKDEWETALREEMDLLGLEDWRLNVYSANQEKDIAKTNQSEAYQIINLWVNILRPPEAQVVRHEIAHGLLCAISNVHDHMIDTIVATEARAYAGKVFADAIERTTERIRMALDSLERNVERRKT